MEITLLDKNSLKKIDKYFNDNNIRSIFIVTFKFEKKPSIITYLESLNIKITYFYDYTPNPTYEEVCKGLESFKKSKADAIIAIGGGSAIDVSKCIKVFSTMDDNINYLNQTIENNNVILISLPTTAGTGSEATRYAVIYYEGNKQSVTSDYLIPDLVIFDPSFLDSLPIYARKATVLDAFSHSIESIWSINSTDESKKYAKEALKIIVSNFKAYLDNKKEVYPLMLKAANLAGKAINITQTTAGHAMCYKLTSLYKIPHGHAACLVNSCLLPYMIDNVDKVIDPRGKEYLIKTFKEIGKVLRCTDMNSLKVYIQNLLDELDLYDVTFNKEDINYLAKSVNITRLKNNPVLLDQKDIKVIYTNLYHDIERRHKNESK